MKLWNSYGTEHSLNLVIIGHFKEEHEAEEFEILTDRIKNFLYENTAFNIDADRFDERTLDFLREENLYSLSAQQLTHLLLDFHITQIKNKIRITSDDDVNALISLLIHKGAKVEVFSAHNYPDEHSQE